jgi:two-component sensor histidine kinase
MAGVLKGEVTDVHDAEVLIERPDGSQVAVIVNIRPLKDQHGRTTGAINCFYDITGRRKTEERQRVLMGELAHRGQNLLAVIQSIVAHSLRGKRPLAEERAALAQRIQALARSQSALMTGGFDGAPLAEIVRLELAGFSDRVTALGPPLILNRRVAQTFSLIVHELATNAIKHGALSSPEGQVAIAWSISDAGADARLRFHWREIGGPPVTAPVRRGFGTTLLEKAAASDFQAVPKILFAPEGLKYEIDTALSVMVQSRLATSSAGPADAVAEGNHPDS